MRSLSPEEAELWARVASTIRPLSRETADPPVIARSMECGPAPNRPVAAPKPAPAARSRPVPIGERTLDGSWDKRLRSGAVEPDRVLADVEANQ